MKVESSPQRNRIRRALLFTPGDDFHKIEKAAASGADSVILDLEDAVALTAKAKARETIVQALTTLDFGRSERLVRINSFGSGFEAEDAKAIHAAASHVDGIVIPKLEHVMEFRAFWKEYHTDKVPAPSMLIIVETALGIVNLRELAQVAEWEPQFAGIIFGAEDLAGSTGAIRTPEGMEVFHARSAVILHAAAYGLQAIDSIYANFQDTAGLTAEAKRALTLGYTGKLAIHPRQIEPINAVFTPSDDAIVQAQRLIAEHDKHQREGSGVFALDGKMVDMPMIRSAERILARARAAGKVSN